MALSLLVQEIRAIGTPALLVEARAAVASALAAAAAEEAGLLRPLETLVIPELERVLGLSEDSTTEEATEAKELGIIEDVEAVEAPAGNLLLDLVEATGLSILFSGKVSMVAAIVVGCSRVVSLVSEVIITFVLEAMEAVAMLPVVPIVALVVIVSVAVVI